MKQNQRLVIRPEETITGFNYAFALALLNKLLEMERTRTIFNERGHQYGFTQMAASVTQYLAIQVLFPDSSNREKYVPSLIAHAREFLAIFEK